MNIESHTATYKQLYVQSHTIRQVTNCTIEWTLPCNYRLWQYGCCPPFFRLSHTLPQFVPKATDLLASL